MKSNWAHKDSKLILPASAPRDEWLAARREGIGGSDVSAILGMTPWKSAYKVWLEKTGRLKDDDEITPQMRWGLLHEPAMRQVFTEDTGIEIRKTGLHLSKIYPHLMVTPDGFTSDGGVFESKTANWRVFRDDWADDEIADHAALQVSHSMGVTGRSHAHVMALSEGYVHRFYRLDRDQATIDAVCAHLENWWESYVIGDTEPPLTNVSLPEVKNYLSIALVDTLQASDPKRVRAMMEHITSLKADAKASSEAAEAMEAELRLIAGEAGEVRDDGEHTLFTLRNDGTFSPSRFLKDFSDDERKAMYHLAPELNMDMIKVKYAKKYTAARARVLRLKKEKE